MFMSWTHHKAAALHIFGFFRILSQKRSVKVKGTSLPSFTVFLSPSKALALMSLLSTQILHKKRIFDRKAFKNLL